MLKHHTTIQQKRLLYRASHRGMKEMDYILGNFAKQNLHKMSAAELNEFEKILELSDRQIYNWCLGMETLNDDQKTPLLMSIINSY
ncbi:succinate dehydrogenase assembly factor 2 [Bartonella sp. DGB1]|uniref:succinate dehydrogenase assembly factor 2 n=1 Tax=Bartonella sp. DGB1 TaxID=3239807 RepID=UPI003525D962